MKIKEAKEKKRLTWGPPMLATLVKKAFSDPDWIYECKLDGVRCLAYKENDAVKLFSRNHKKLNSRFEEIVALIKKQRKKQFIIDGEIVAFENQISSFSKLQGRIHLLDEKKRASRKIKVYFYVFDILHLDGWDLKKVPLIERKKILKRSIQFSNGLRFVVHRAKQGEKYFKQAAKKGWEGLIAKEKHSTYVHSRSKKWQKFKCGKRQEFIIVGYTDPGGSRIGFGSLLIGYYKNRKLHYAGKVGTGYDMALLKKLSKRLKSIERKTNPFKGLKVPKSAHFVQPKILCEIGYTEWTKDGKLRHPRFLGLRSDKNAKKVRRERAL